VDEEAALMMQGLESSDEIEGYLIASSYGGGG
jgi:hypothetical protein